MDCQTCKFPLPECACMRLLGFIFPEITDITRYEKLRTEVVLHETGRFLYYTRYRYGNDSLYTSVLILDSLGFIPHLKINDEFL